MHSGRVTGRYVRLSVHLRSDRWHQSREDLHTDGGRIIYHHLLVQIQYEVEHSTQRGPYHVRTHTVLLTAEHRMFGSCKTRSYAVQFPARSSCRAGRALRLHGKSSLAGVTDLASPCISDLRARRLTSCDSSCDIVRGPLGVSHACLHAPLTVRRSCRTIDY
ncbi:uncharacterized protein K452DRAFT_48504 [Aplosporella prunicola CBS 121167]|uniref:Uncharacterized protein n=1 Tax=Aplosporella prunicola CBS 121167 TaxID=1176127 RepID=A0A6A6BAG3_9PEZI|nr:uncharacterized protein K452DRAFT_48504 [Aplosporella prunicola CBS 121167]KAF2140578.1 hypothetical protein K452DRAFT_48504 [Aplosporella prunicola CBS 121167]